MGCYLDAEANNLVPQEIHLLYDRTASKKNKKSDTVDSPLLNGRKIPSPKDDNHCTKALHAVIGNLG